MGCYPRGPLLNFEMESKKVTQLDKALQKMAADDDAPLASISDDVQLPPGAYIPDSLEQRELVHERQKKPTQNIKGKKSAVEGRLAKFMTLLKSAEFDANFLTNLEVLSRQMSGQLWDQIKQHSRNDDVYIYFVQQIKTGLLVVYICRKVVEVMRERREFSRLAIELIARIDDTADRSDFEIIDSYHTRLGGGMVLPLAQWIPRSMSRSMSGLSSLGSGGGSSSGCSSPTSSIGGSSNGLGVALTPRVHSKNPLITRLLPWTVIKGFAQSEVVAALFEAYAAADETPHTGKEMYIFADCTVIALTRSLLQNECFLTHACQPISPTKRRRDGVETHPESVPEDRVQVSKALVDYIRFIHDHASDMHTDDSVSIATLVERHLQQLLPCACEYLGENEFIGF